MEVMPDKPPKHGRSVEIDPARLTEVMNRRGFSVEELARQSGKSVGTISNLLAGKSVYRSTTQPVAKALQVPVDALLKKSSCPAAISTVHEYLIAEVLTNWQTASNGLRFQICRLRHLELDRQARGKRFDLRDLPSDEAQRCRTMIKRHPNVCETLSGQPNIIRNQTAFHDPEELFYWVIDEWIDGESLQRHLRTPSFDEASTQRFLLDLAHGLQALHDQGIVRRELNPASVLIRRDNGRAVLTEFELAKLIDHGPTVSTDQWPVDPYRAGEANSQDVDIRADIYSWARIGIHVAAGHLPEVPLGKVEWNGIAMPESVRMVLLQASSVLRSDRPQTLTEIVPVIERWS